MTDQHETARPSWKLHSFPPTKAFDMSDAAAIASALEEKKTRTAQLLAQLAAAQAEEAELAAAGARLLYPEIGALEASCPAALEAARATLATLAAESAAHQCKLEAARAEEEACGAAAAAAAAAAEASGQAAAAAEAAVVRLEAKARLLPLYRSCSAAAARATGAPAHFAPAFQGVFSVCVRLQEDMGIAFSDRVGMSTVHRVASVAPGGPMAAVGVRAGDVLFSWEHCFLAGGAAPEGVPPFFDRRPSSGEPVAMAFERGVWQ